MIANVGVDFHYTLFETTLTIDLPFIVFLNDSTHLLILDEYYHMLDKHTLKKLVQSSTYIENGYITKECNL